MLLRYGLSHHRAGRLDAAERTYRSVLAEDPQSADALHLLGQVLLQRGRDDEAETLVRGAVEASSATALYHNTLGEILRRRGDSAAAEAAYAEALALDADYAEAWSNRGALARAEGRLDEAAAQLRRAVALRPDFAAAHNNLGTVLLEQGEPAAAAECFRAALASAPELAEAHGNLGNALRRLGEAQAALESFGRALALDPGNADAEANRAAARADAGDLAGAIEGYRRAVDLSPDNPMFHHGLGVALFRAGRFAKAIEAFRATLAREPDHLEALTNLGNSLVRKSRLEEGIAAHERALALDPDCDRAYFSLLASMPGACDWDRLDALARELSARVDAVCENRRERRGGMLPLAFTLPYFSTDIALHKRVLVAVSERLVDRLAAAAPRFDHPPGDPDKRLRIGYLSPDFGDHPIGHVTVPVYELHDRARFEVCCYATVDRSGSGGPHFERIRASADHFVDVSAASAAEIAARINADRVDIVVDLCGFMPGGRADALALRPAPVQVYWLGHGGGLGARYIDYVIGDRFVTPPEDDRHYVERIARLPDTFSSADRAEVADVAASREAEGLPERGFVFCAFNNALKIDRHVFECWMEILEGVPESVLWLNASAGHGVRGRLRAAAAARSVAPERLVFADRVPDKAQHLARHALAELFLDTFTFNASTTALDALWAGLPVLTVAGPHFHSRIAAGYVSAVGMPELVCPDRDSYRARAIELAFDREALAALAAKLARTRLSAPLFDGKRFVGHLESAYRSMWRRFCAGLAPESFEVAPGAPEARR
jgi:predicted O-linked N-acetylglucosamine transferase (SPINDLY family)